MRRAAISSIFHNALIHAFGSIFLGLLLIISSAPLHAQNCEALKNTPINESYTLDPNLVISCIEAGIDPPPSWLQHGSGFKGSFKTFGRLMQSILPAPRAQLKYRDKGCNYYSGNSSTGEGETKPGGKSDEGAFDACIKDEGAVLAASPDILVKIPEIGTPEVECLTNLFIGGTASVSGGGSSGDFNFGTPPTGTSSVSGGTCAAGNIGVCGIGTIGGTVCTDINPDGGSSTDGSGNSCPYSKAPDPKYVMLYGVTAFDYQYNVINADTTIYLPDGGYVEYGSQTATIQAEGYVTMSSDGEVYVSTGYGCGGGNSRYSSGAFAQLSTDEAVTIVPQNGILLIDDALLKGETIDGNGNYYTPVVTEQPETMTDPNLEVDPGTTTLQGTPNGGAQEQPPGNPADYGGLDTNVYAGAFPPDVPTEAVDPNQVVDSQGKPPVTQP